MSRLIEIFQTKREEVREAQAALPLAELKNRARDVAAPRGFKRALQGHPDLGLIAEVKQASPSQGSIRPNLDPVAVALAYERAGAHCLSVLTDGPYFQGSPENLQKAREATQLPILRKDFMLDPYQIWEAKAWGADAVLLIVAGIERGLLADLLELALELEMDALVEVHSIEEAETALALGCDFIGVNNRDLATFETSLSTSETILPLLEGHAFGVSESALASRADLDRVKAAGAGAVLIGTTFCGAPDVDAKVREVMAW